MGSGVHSLGPALLLAWALSPRACFPFLENGVWKLRTKNGELGELGLRGLAVPGRLRGAEGSSRVHTLLFSLDDLPVNVSHLLILSVVHHVVKDHLCGHRPLTVLSVAHGPSLCPSAVCLGNSEFPLLTAVLLPGPRTSPTLPSVVSPGGRGSEGASGAQRRGGVPPWVPPRFHGFLCF